ncbi:MAG: ribonuclease P protein component [Candidatus Hepatoplasma vulgare]|nr:MAG: ribonuclease P protein component [Candidatus Hepatoplasma sp.]
MKKDFLLKKEELFELVIKTGKKIYFKELSVYWLSSESFQVGISVPKKLGNAVLRNKNKRQIKNIIDTYKFEKIKKQFVIIVNKNFIDKTFEEKSKIIKTVLKKISKV